MKKQLPLLLAVLVLGVLFCLPVRAADTVASGTCDDLNWILTDDGTLTISGSGDIRSYPWTGTNWSEYKDSIIHLRIDEGITKIDYAAFHGYPALTDVSLPESLTEIGPLAFRYSRALTSITLPKGLTVIGREAFAYCSALTEISVPGTVKRVEDQTFQSCTALARLELQPGVEEIGITAFAFCGQLESVQLPDTVTLLERQAFFGCDQLRSVTLPGTLTNIGGEVFRDTPYLLGITDSEGFAVVNGVLQSYTGVRTEVVIPAPVTVIAGNAFAYRSDITSVTLPQGLLRIQGYAFAACSGLTAVSIPETVILVEASAFWNCSALSQAEYDDASVFFGNPFEGTPFSKAHTDEQGLVVIDGRLIDYSGPGGALVIPETVHTIHPDFLRDKQAINALSLPGTVKEIQAETFAGCANLRTVTLADGVTRIGDGAFRDCKLLESFFIPDSVTEIGAEAFLNCWNLQDLTGLGGIVSIGDRAFHGCYVRELHFPLSLNTIGDGAISGIADKITYAGTLEDWAKVRIGAGNTGLLNCPPDTLSLEPYQSFIRNDTLYEMYSSTPVPSAFISFGDGYMRAEFLENSDTPCIIAERYDGDFRLTDQWTIPLELPLYGGILLGEDYHFVVTGQGNPEEDDSLEVIRITRYSTDWKRIDCASLTAARVRIPFHAGTLRFARSGDYLFIRTSRARYADEAGVVHQTNLTLNVRISNMTVVEHLSGPTRTSESIVSHSFDQYLYLDEDTLLAADLGDYYPRAVVLFRFNREAGANTLAGKAANVNVLDIAGRDGLNHTGVQIGALSSSDTHYLVAGSSIVQDDADFRPDGQQNIFVCAVPKNNFTSEATNVIWLTDYVQGDYVKFSLIHLVPLSGDRLVLLWSTGSDDLYYCILSADGSPASPVYHEKAWLSPTPPIFDGEKLLWYSTGRTASVDGSYYQYKTSPVFFTMDPEAPETVTLLCPLHLYVGGVCTVCGHEDLCSQGHSWQEATCKVPQTCTVCGATQGEVLEHSYRDGQCVMCQKLEKDLIGDADGDGEITYLDAMQVLRHSVGLGTLAQPELCDVDGSGAVDYLDAMQILRCAVGLTTLN